MPSFFLPRFEFKSLTNSETFRGKSSWILVNLVLIFKSLVISAIHLFCTDLIPLQGLSNPNTFLNHTTAIHSAMPPVSLEAQFYHGRYKAVNILCGQNLAIYWRFARQKHFRQWPVVRSSSGMPRTFVLSTSSASHSMTDPAVACLLLLLLDSERLPWESFEHMSRGTYTTARICFSRGPLLDSSRNQETGLSSTKARSLCLKS